MLRRLLIALVAIVVLLQFYRPERDNPPVDPAMTLAAHVEVPAEVQALLDRSCSDCHSHSTEWPWYSQIAPMSWSVAHHVEEGREHLNFDRWGEYTPYEAQQKLGEMCEETKEGEMPLGVYLPMHPDAKLSDADVELLCGWALQNMLVLRTEAGASAPDHEESHDEGH
jgi:hypothetical protein